MVQGGLVGDGPAGGQSGRKEMLACAAVEDGAWEPMDLTMSSQDQPTRHVEGERMAYMPIFLAMCRAAAEVRHSDSQMRTQGLPHSRVQEKCHYPFLCVTGLWDFGIKVQAGPSDVR